MIKFEQVLWQNLKSISGKILLLIAVLVVCGSNINTAWSQCTFPSSAVVRPTDLGSQDQFATSIAIDEDIALIGAPRQPTASDKGAVYVATHGTSWAITQKLIAPDGANGHQFGKAVAVNGSWAVVGAPGTSAVYVYQLSGSTLTYQQKLTPSLNEAGDLFGSSLAILGNTLVVGAYGSNSYVGRVYVFKYNGASWVQSQVLNSTEGATYDFFGFALGISNNVIVAGAYGDDEPGGTNFGLVYVFNFDGAQWQLQQRLQAPDGGSGDSFGESVAIDGGKIVIGASRDDDLGSNSGAAYVFNLNGTQWSFEKKLNGSDSKAGDWFGTSVAIRGGLITIGSPLWDDLTGITNRGAVYPFLFDGNTWNAQAKLLPPAPWGFYDDNFGNVVALTTSTIIGGANLADWMGRDTGETYFYDVQCNVAPTITLSSPPNGYIDPLEDKNAATGVLLGTTDVSITFSAPMTSSTGGALSLANFERKYFRAGAEVSAVTADLGNAGVAPTVTLVSGTGAGPYLLRFSPRIPLGAWTQIKAINVVGPGNVPISASGNRIVLGSCPMDITQDGKVLGGDISRWLAINSGAYDPAPLTNLQLLDQRRNGLVAGEDITRGIQLLNGTPGTTFQAWTGFDLGMKP